MVDKNGSHPSQRPPVYPHPQPPVFNPFWLCCLCCNICCPKLSESLSSIASGAADSLFDGLVRCADAAIAFVCGRLLISLGPLVVVLGLTIIAQLAFTFFTIILPMLVVPGVAGWFGMLHASLVVFLLANILFNYFQCATVGQARYCSAVRELAVATGFEYPESDAELLACRERFTNLIGDRHRAYEKWASEHRNVPADAGNQTLRKRVGTTARSPEPEAVPMKTIKHQPPVWMFLGPEEWGFCTRSNQPKPPRAHFDSVTKQLVLNLDHFCPWTFSPIGFFNYRYFVTFLINVEIAMTYGLIVGYRPFSNGYGTAYEEQIEMSKAAGHDTTVHLIPFTPTEEEKRTVAVAYTLVIFTFLGVGRLLWHHVTLILSAQTTIEKLASQAREQRVLRSGKTWKNPYSLGAKENWQMVFGSGHPLLALLPSCREPEFLPLPVNGKLVERVAPDQFTHKTESWGNRAVV